MKLKLIFTVSLLCSVLFFSSIPSSYQHGLGSKILPPMLLGEKQVSLKVTSFPHNSDKQIQFSLFDVSNGFGIKDVIYHITATKANTFLFDETFSTSSGVFTITLHPNNNNVKVIHQNESTFFESLLGLEKETVHVSGTPFNTGGLYLFKVEIISTEYGEYDPIYFHAGVSIPQKTSYDINNVNFGMQKLEITTYYDEIQNFVYHSNDKSISFMMPFEWSIPNINQTLVIHEEIIIPKTFGDLLVPRYNISINDFEIPQKSINVDDFSETQRTIHLMINQNDLFELYEKQNTDQNMMIFSIEPAESDFSLGAITANGVFKIFLGWLPKDIKSDSTTNFIFDIEDLSLKNDSTAYVDYDIVITHDDKTLFSTNGKSEKNNEFSLFIPKDVSGLISINFLNLDGNKIGKATFPVIVNRMQSIDTIPDWIRDNANLWSKGELTDSEFVLDVEFLIKKRIINIPFYDDFKNDISLPHWFKNNTKWWNQKSISDEEYISGLEFLLK